MNHFMNLDIENGVSIPLVCVPAGAYEMGRPAILSIMSQDTANMTHSCGLEELEGLIERVTFHSPESGFCHFVCEQ